MRFTRNRHFQLLLQPLCGHTLHNIRFAYALWSSARHNEERSFLFYFLPFFSKGTYTSAQKKKREAEALSHPKKIEVNKQKDAVKLALVPRCRCIARGRAKELRVRRGKVMESE